MLDFATKAIIHHVRTRAIVTEALEVLFCLYLIYLKARDPDFQQIFMLYPAGLALVLSGTIAYRRTISVRGQDSYVDLTQLDQRKAFLFGEMAACLLVTLVGLLITIIFAGVVAPAVVFADGPKLVLGTGFLLVGAATAITVTFLLSGLALPSDTPSVLAIVVIVFGFSRSSLGAEMNKAIHQPQIVEPVVAVLKVLVPPLEELTRASMTGEFADYLPALANALGYLVLTGLGAVWLFNRRRFEAKPQARPGGSEETAERGPSRHERRPAK